MDEIRDSTNFIIFILLKIKFTTDVFGPIDQSQLHLYDQQPNASLGIKYSLNIYFVVAYVMSVCIHTCQTTTEIRYPGN